MDGLSFSLKVPSYLSKKRETCEEHPSPGPTLIGSGRSIGFQPSKILKTFGHILLKCSFGLVVFIMSSVPQDHEFEPGPDHYRPFF